MTIGEVSEPSGVASSALRFYEERGLIASERAGSGHRRYQRAVLRRIAYVVFAQRVGLSLEEVGRRAREAARRSRAHAERLARLSAGWASRIDARIAELEPLRTGLTECIGCGRLSLERCPFSYPHDRAAERGPGPRYWLRDRPLG
jgi:MerR family redox-sensitive transcriptional activator SoxR